MNIENLKYIIQQRNSIIWIKTKEYKRCIKKINTLIKDLNKNIFFLDFNSNITDKNGNYIKKFSSINDLYFNVEDSVIVLKKYNDNLIRFIDKDKNSIIIISENLDIPGNIKQYITCLALELPGLQELKDIYQKIKRKYLFSEYKLSNSINYEEKICCLAKGLTEDEFVDALQMSILKNGEILPDFIIEQKKQLIENNKIMKVCNFNNNFSEIIGLDSLKIFSKKMILSGNGKGVLISGFPGCGKSILAKSLGVETGILTISLDTNLENSLSYFKEKFQESLNLIEQISPSILFIDEIEKLFLIDSSIENQFLNWFNQKGSDVYVVATVNNLKDLSSKFLNFNKWDGIFFIDIPNKNLQNKLFDFYKKKYAIDISDDFNIDEKIDYTGAEIETLCRLSKSLNISFKEANKYIYKISEDKKNEFENIRKSIKERVLMIND